MCAQLDQEMENANELATISSISTHWRLMAFFGANRLMLRHIARIFVHSLFYARQPGGVLIFPPTYARAEHFFVLPASWNEDIIGEVLMRCALFILGTPAGWNACVKPKQQQCHRIGRQN